MTGALSPETSMIS